MLEATAMSAQREAAAARTADEQPEVDQSGVEQPGPTT